MWKTNTELQLLSSSKCVVLFATRQQLAAWTRSVYIHTAPCTSHITDSWRSCICWNNYLSSSSRVPSTNLINRTASSVRLLHVQNNSKRKIWRTMTYTIEILVHNQCHIALKLDKIEPEWTSCNQNNAHPTCAYLYRCVRLKTNANSCC